MEANIVGTEADMEEKKEEDKESMFRRQQQS